MLTFKGNVELPKWVKRHQEAKNNYFYHSWKAEIFSKPVNYEITN